MCLLRKSEEYLFTKIKYEVSVTAQSVFLDTDNRDSLVADNHIKMIMQTIPSLYQYGIKLGHNFERMFVPQSAPSLLNKDYCYTLIFQSECGRYSPV